MVVTELDSFVQKFHQLWRAGVTAYLDIDTHAGNSLVGLRVQLGHVPDPVHQFAGHHREPAYQHRHVSCQEARAAEAAADTSPTSADLRSSDALPADEASNTSNTEQVDNTEKLKEKDSSEQANFPCNICDFERNWANGLNVHMTVTTWT